LDDMRKNLKIDRKIDEQLNYLAVLDVDKQNCQKEVDKLSIELQKLRNNIKVTNIELEKFTIIKANVVSQNSIARTRNTLC
jgi:hypothetical protein